MSNTTATTAQNEPAAVEVKKQLPLGEFVLQVIDSYAGDFAAFSKLTLKTDADAVKSHKASIYISDIATIIAKDYIKQTGDLSDCIDNLSFQTAAQLVTDTRVGKALGLFGTDIWDRLAEQLQFSDAISYNNFLKGIQAHDSLRAQQSRWCC